jgi:ArsR family transcriptional regulator
MFRKIAAQEMAKFMQLLAHPSRIMILHEIRKNELTVTALQKLTGVSQSRISQHLSALRTEGVIKERREGRNVYYHLVDSSLTDWLLNGMDLAQKQIKVEPPVKDALVNATDKWK